MPDQTPAFATTYTTAGTSLIGTRCALPKRLLGVWAHPDDEAYLSAGLMARVSEAGGSVTVLTATRGEHGTDDPREVGSPAFGSHRAAELATSLDLLGVHDLRFLDLPDGGCDTADDDAQVCRILNTINEVQPDAIVTFGPDGITNHLDHRAVSRWTTEAWRRGPSADLLYAATTFDHAERFAEVHDRIGVYADFPDAAPRAISLQRVALEVALTEPELTRKRQALAAHASQTDSLAAEMGEATYRGWFRDEHFRRPTAAEIYRCELPAWQRPVQCDDRELVGAST